MSSNSFKVSFESKFEFDVDPMLYAESAVVDETVKMPKTEDFSEFEKCKNANVKRMEMKKKILNEFTEKIVEIYSTKFGELLLKQEAEIDEMKNDFLQNVKAELELWQKSRNTIKKEEEKLIKLFESLRKLYNSPEIQNQTLKKIADMYNDFFDRYEKLIMKQESEMKSLKEVIKEEVEKVKENLSREYWMKESDEIFI